MLKAVQIGAGNIGRGFLGQILFESGFATTFVDTNPELVALLQRRGDYPLRLVSPNDQIPNLDLIIGNVTAINPLEFPNDAIAAIANADVIGTSVGVSVLPKIAPLLAAAISMRAPSGDSINILLCENQQHCADVMRQLLAPYFSPGAREYFDGRVGLVETVIGRMVPVPAPPLLAEDPLLIVAEPYMELPIAGPLIKGELPALKHIIPADDFAAYEARKLFMHNAGHAALAYLGYLHGHEFIWEAAQDARSRAVCESLLEQVKKSMVSAFPGTIGMDAAALRFYVGDLLTRFENKKLGDTVVRVAADPIRKLQPSDRLIGAAEFCRTHGVDDSPVAAVVAAALRFDYPGDVSAAKLQEMKRTLGNEAVLEEICGLSRRSRLGEKVLAELGDLKA